MVAEIRNLKFHQVKDFCGIIFVFAGHGGEGDYLWMQDGTKLQIIRDVIDPLLPKNAKEVGNIKKAFLIDACRGEQPTQTTVMLRSSYDPELRGLEWSLVDAMKMHGGGNFLIAHSTLPMLKAYENTGSGGVWLSTLAELLSQKKYLFSLEYLLTAVNEEMVKKMQGSSFQQPEFQQPEKWSRLDGHLSLEG
jgi:hypothetical protein